MAPRKYKARPLSITAIPRSSRWPWAELPPNLVQLGYRVSHLLLYTSSPATIKSWVTTTRRCNATEQHQWPQLHHLNADSSKASSTTISYPHNCFLGDDSCISGVLCQRPNASYWCIMKVDTTSTIPPSSTLSSNHAINPVAGIVRLAHVRLAGIPSTTLIVNYTIDYHTYYRYMSIAHECTTVDPFDAKKKYMEFTSMVRCEGRFYALSLQGTLAVLMLDVDSRLKITAISTSRAVPSVSSRFFKEYIIEMKGEIFLVFLIHQKSLRVVDHVEVFRLGFVELDWIKVQRLQGKTLFLNKCCIWANSAEIGCRENYVYFTQGSDNNWWIYDMERGCISPV